MNRRWAVDATWAHFSQFNRVYSLSVAGTKEVVRHREEREDDLDRESSSWLAVATLIYD